MKKKIIFIYLFTGLFFFQTSATNLRGYIQMFNSYTGGYFPAANTQVNFLFWNAGQWVVGTSVITGYDGMYYFPNIQPGFTYYLQINGAFYPITITSPTYQDIPVITIPFQ